MMTYDEFVNKPYRIWLRVLHKADEVLRIEAICTKATTTYGEKVQSSFDNSQEKNYLALIDAKKELNELLEEHKEAESAVRSFFYGYLDADEADIMEWKYIDGKSPKQIAKIRNEQEQTIRNKISRYENKARKIFIKV